MLQQIEVSVESFGTFSVAPQNEAEKEFWDILARGQWEAGTIAAINLSSSSGTVFWDIGAWIGPISLLALAKGCQVIAFDADPIALKALSKNVSLNPIFANRITIIPKVLSADSKPKNLKAQGTFGDSMSSIVGAGSEVMQVEAISVDQALSDFPLPSGSVVKIDIEGGEYGLGSTFWTNLAEKKVFIILSTHPTILAPFYRVPSMVGRNRAIAIVRSLRPTFLILRALRGMEFYGDYAPTTKRFRRLGIARLVWRLFSGRNQTFLISPGLLDEI